MDGESGIVYGHVAAVDAFDEAYVVPLASVVDRILLGLPAKAVRLDWPAEPDPHATADDPRNVASEPPPAATHSLAPYRRGNIVSLQVDAKADSVGSSGQDSGYGSWASSARSSSNEMDHAHPPLTVVPTSGLPFGRPAEGNFTSSTSQPNLTSLRRVAGVDQRPVDLLYGRDRDQALLHTEMTNTKSRIDRVTAAKASELSPEESSDGAGEAELASLNRVMSRIRASKYFAECYKQGQNDDEAGSASKVELEPKRKSQSHQSEERMRPAYGEHITEAAESAEGFDAMEHDDEILRRKPAERSNPATAGNTQAEGQTTYFSRSKWTSASNTKSATPQQSTTEKDALDRAQRPARRSRLTDSM